MAIYPYFYVPWLFFWVFMLGFSLGSGTQCMDRMHRPYGAELSRAPAKEKEELLWVCWFFGSLLALNLTRFLLPECKGCFGRTGTDFNVWKAAAFIVFIFHGLLVRLLFELIKDIKAPRKVNRFLNDCSAEGCIRAIYETTSHRLYGSFEWVLHDMMRDEHDLWKIAKRAVSGYKDDPVYIAVNIPPEQVLQKLSQYNLVTKNGYERLPPPKPDHYLPQGGSIVQFYYQAEYVRIWG